MSTLLLLTSALQPSAEVLPGLALLGHSVKILPAEGSALLEAPDSDLLLVDGRQDLAHARDLCRLIRTTGVEVPVLLVLTEGGLAAVSHDWSMDDVLLASIGPAELEARLRVATGRLRAAREAVDPEAHLIRSGEVVVDEATYIIPLEGVIDIEAERARLSKALQSAEKERDSLAARLSNASFVERAKPEAVEKARADHEEKASDAEKYRAALARLG